MPRMAGVLWLAAGLAYLAAETVAAMGFPQYDYAGNYISDLGVPELSPRAWLMNLGLVIDGTLYGIAAILAVRAWRTGAWFLAAALCHAVGTVIVGTVHAGPLAAADGTLLWHVLGAGAAIIGGNLASLITPGPPFVRSAGRILGWLGLASLTALESQRLFGATFVADGLLERGAVYPITVWELVAGVTAFTRRSSPVRRGA